MPQSSSPGTSGSHDTKARLYFPGLNGLRFIAAFMVFIGHVEFFIKNGGGNYISLYMLGAAGKAGVNMFFVISGYLITYLLLTERARYNTIALKNFYVRRVLRIWPLYYLIALVTLLIIPALVKDDLFFVNGISDIRGILLFIVFLPFVGMVFYPSNFMANILWSVGVEEIYYVFWPAIIRAGKSLSLLRLIVVLIVFLVFKTGFTYLPYKVQSHQDIFIAIKSIFSSISFDQMIVGGIAAYLAFHKHSMISILRNNIAFALAIVIWCIFLFIGLQKMYFGVNPIVEYMIDPLIYATCCAVIILNVTHGHVVSRILETNVMYQLGQISYGFYVYHSIALFVVYRVAAATLHITMADVTMHWLLYLAGFVLTTFTAYVSYHYFEVRFLHLKKKFTTIVSGDDARAKSQAN